MTRFAEILNACPDSEVVVSTYINMFLFPLALAERFGRKLLRLTPPTADISIPPFGLNYFMWKVFAAERTAIINGIGLPFGLSILGVLRKKQV